MAIKPRGIRRKIDDWGRVVLPKNLLTQFELGPRDTVEIYPTARGFFICAEGEQIAQADLDRIESVEM